MGNRVPAPRHATRKDTAGGDRRDAQSTRPCVVRHQPQYRLENGTGRLAGIDLSARTGHPVRARFSAQVGLGARATIDRLIVNSPYQEPARHWRHDRTTRLLDLAEGRRPAGCVVASSDSSAFDNSEVFVEIPLVNQVRDRVRARPEAGYPGVTGVTIRLLNSWCLPKSCQQSECTPSWEGAE